MSVRSTRTTTTKIGNTQRWMRGLRRHTRKTLQREIKINFLIPYVKAIRWASDRIGEEGVVALVTNNSFLDGVAFDGMRKHLADDFDAIYILDLGGNARRGLKVSDANVFGIRVGVSINLFVKTGRAINRPTNRGQVPIHRDPRFHDGYPQSEIALFLPVSFTIAPMTYGTKNRSLIS